MSKRKNMIQDPEKCIRMKPNKTDHREKYQNRKEKNQTRLMKKTDKKTWSPKLK